MNPFVCVELVNGFCSAWAEAAVSFDADSVVRGSSTKLTGSELGEIFTQGFAFTASVVVLAYIARWAVISLRAIS